MYNVFISDASHFVVEVPRSEMLEFVEAWLHQPVQEGYPGAGKKVLSIAVIKLGEIIKLMIRHEAAMIEQPKPATVPEELAKMGFKSLKDVPAHKLLSMGG